MKPNVFSYITYQKLHARLPGFLRLCIGLSFGLLAACTSLPTLEERRTVAEALASEHQWQAETIGTENFELVTWLPRVVVQQASLTIYVEGDGFAWVSSDLPSVDPTPRNPVGLRLALAQQDGNAAYLARPCQYIDAASNSCPQRYWTYARFAPEVISAMNHAIDVLKNRFGAQHLTLVGYSGGGAVVTLLAAWRNDVVRLVTVAGNLDHQAWTRYHRIDPLRGSLNSAEVATALEGMPQVHFIGARDRVVPPELARQWPQGFRGRDAANLHIVPEADHACCWATQWPTLFTSVQ